MLLPHNSALWINCLAGAVSNQGKKAGSMERRFWSPQSGDQRSSQGQNAEVTKNQMPAWRSQLHTVLAVWEVRWEGDNLVEAGK